MSPFEFSPLGPRFCQRCQRPLAGRSDQKYCGDRCRGMAYRHGVGGLDWPARAEAAEQLAQQLQTQLAQQAQAQAAAQPYEQRYEEVSRLLGMLAREQTDGRVLPVYTDFVDQVLQAYQQHPGLATGDVTAQRRLMGLQQLRTELAGAYQQLLANQKIDQYWKEREQAQLAAAKGSLND